MLMKEKKGEENYLQMIMSTMKADIWQHIEQKNTKTIPPTSRSDNDDHSQRKYSTW